MSDPRERCAKVAQHVLHMFDAGGVQPGEFSLNLYRAIASADAENRQRLEAVFPVEVNAYKLALYHEHGIELLKQISEWSDDATAPASVD